MPWYNLSLVGDALQADSSIQIRTLYLCRAGTFRGFNDNLRTCSNCPAGQSSSAGGACAVCNAGRFQPNSGQPSCRDCPQAQFTSSAGATTCQGCSAGRAASCGSSVRRDSTPGCTLHSAEIDAAFASWKTNAEHRCIFMRSLSRWFRATPLEALVASHVPEASFLQSRAQRHARLSRGALNWRVKFERLFILRAWTIYICRWAIMQSLLRSKYFQIKTWCDFLHKM